jgi:hypothetical protein
MPDRLAQVFALVPATRYNWTPPSWEGIPGERFSALGQICHVRDIEQLGYHVRITRLLSEKSPSLVSLDSYELAAPRNYPAENPRRVLEAFRTARQHTLGLLEGLTAEQLSRRGTFGEYGEVTLQAVVHYLTSHDHQHLACMEWLLGQMHASEG